MTVDVRYVYVGCDFVAAIGERATSESDFLSLPFSLFLFWCVSLHTIVCFKEKSFFKINGNCRWRWWLLLMLFVVALPILLSLFPSSIHYDTTTLANAFCVFFFSFFFFFSCCCKHGSLVIDLCHSIFVFFFFLNFYYYSCHHAFASWNLSSCEYYERQCSSTICLLCVNISVFHRLCDVEIMCLCKH